MQRTSGTGPANTSSNFPTTTGASSSGAFGTSLPGGGSGQTSGVKPSHLGNFGNTSESQRSSGFGGPTGSTFGPGIKVHLPNHSIGSDQGSTGLTANPSEVSQKPIGAGSVPALSSDQPIGGSASSKPVSENSGSNLFTRNNTTSGGNASGSLFSAPTNSSGGSGLFSTNNTAPGSGASGLNTGPDAASGSGGSSIFSTSAPALDKAWGNLFAKYATTSDASTSSPFSRLSSTSTPATGNTGGGLFANRPAISGNSSNSTFANSSASGSAAIGDLGSNPFARATAPSATANSPINAAGNAPVHSPSDASTTNADRDTSAGVPTPSSGSGKGESPAAVKY